MAVCDTLSLMFATLHQHLFSAHCNHCLPYLPPPSCPRPLSPSCLYCLLQRTLMTSMPGHAIIPCRQRPWNTDQLQCCCCCREWALHRLHQGIFRYHCYKDLGHFEWPGNHGLCLLLLFCAGRDSGRSLLFVEAKTQAWSVRRPFDYI